MTDSFAQPDRPLAPHWAKAAALLGILAVLHTWPLATNPAGLSLNANADAQLNAWIVAWIAHQLPRSPFTLFDANIFHPADNALAFSEPLIVPALLGAPVAWAGGSPVLAFNLLLLAGLTLTGLAAYGVALAWTKDRAAALVAGSLFAFNTHMLTRLPHLQALHAYGLPLALYFGDRLVVRPGRGAALGLAASMTLLVYTSGYLAVFAAILLGVLIAVRVADWRRHARQTAAAFALAAVVSSAAALPVYLPYRRAALEQGLVRTIEGVGEFSATLRGYLAASGRIHASTWSARFHGNPVNMFFPGMAALILAAAALASAAAERRHRARVAMLAAVGAAGVVLSLGPATPVYGLLFEAFPPMQGLRAAARFGSLFLLAVALLAAFGLARLRAGCPGRAGAALAVVAVAAVNLEALTAPFSYRPFGGIPRVYSLLAREPGPVVLAETPFYPPHAAFENGEYVLNSTAHWRPLMNGYSGYVPATYRQVAWTFWYFPEERAIDAMKAAGVTHVTVHPPRFGPEAAGTLERLARRPDFELLAIGAGDGLRLYRLR